MKQLIVSEIKKLYKNRLNQVLLCLTVLVTIGLTVFLYYGNSEFIMEYESNYQDFKGHTLSNIDAYRYKDQLLSQYEGEWDEEKLKQIEQESLALMEKYPIPIDEEQMKEEYGNSYKELVKKSKENILTLQELKETLKAEEKTLENISYKEENGYVKIYIHYATERDGISPTETYLRTLHGDGYAYLQFYGFDNEYPRGVEQFHELGYSSFSSPIPHNIFIKVFNKISLPILIFLMIMLANIYGIEKQNNMEQIIYATKLTKKRILQSKFIAGIIFSACVGLSALIICFIVGNIILPVHSFQMPVMDLGSNIVIGQYEAHLEYWQLYLILMSVYMTGLIAMSIVSMLVSYVFKAQFKVIIILMLTLFMTIFLQGTTFYFPFIIRSLLPQSMCYSHMLAYVFGTYTTGELPFVFGNVPLWIFVIGVWLVIMVAVYFFISRCGKKSYVWR